MYALYRVGGEVERLVGAGRLSGHLPLRRPGRQRAWRVALEPRDRHGRRLGGMCGVLGAAAVWVLCNGRHLPRSLARQIRGQYGH